MMMKSQQKRVSGWEHENVSREREGRQMPGRGLTLKGPQISLIFADQQKPKSF
jgi:hypothetical protein